MQNNKTDNDLLHHCLAAITLCGLLVYWFFADYFGHELIAEIAIFAILAMSLDFIAGFGGLVSLGHAALFGGGAYIYAYANLSYGVPPLSAMTIAVSAMAIISASVALVIVRLHGLFFIIMTLALGSMGYEFIFKNRNLGGDDGIAGIERADISLWGQSTSDPQVFSFVLILLVGVIYILLWRLLRSPFGELLQSLHENEGRMRALGVAPTGHRTAAFTISGAIAAFAGCLTAQHVMFISPQLLHWTVSGEILVMVILGGIETLVGGIIGAVILVLLRHEVSSYTDYWGLFLGLFLIAVIFLGGRGVCGGVNSLFAYLRKIYVRD